MELELSTKIAVCTALAIVATLVFQTLKRRTSKVIRCLGTNGQEKVELVHKSGARCDVYLHGATVTRYATPSGHEVLWVSNGAVFDGKKGIRGGVRRVASHLERQAMRRSPSSSRNLAPRPTSCSVCVFVVRRAELWW